MSSICNTTSPPKLPAGAQLLFRLQIGKSGRNPQSSRTCRAEASWYSTMSRGCRSCRMPTRKLTAAMRGETAAAARRRKPPPAREAAPKRAEFSIRGSPACAAPTWAPAGTPASRPACRTMGCAETSAHGGRRQNQRPLSPVGRGVQADAAVDVGRLPWLASARPVGKSRFPASDQDDDGSLAGLTFSLPLASAGLHRVGRRWVCATIRTDPGGASDGTKASTAPDLANPLRPGQG